METSACETDEGAEFGGGPLRGGGGAVDAGEVCGAFLEGGELGEVSIGVSWELYHRREEGQKEVPWFWFLDRLPTS